MQQNMFLELVLLGCIRVQVHPKNYRYQQIMDSFEFFSAILYFYPNTHAEGQPELALSVFQKKLTHFGHMLPKK